jgi:beta-glucosidase
MDRSFELPPGQDELVKEVAAVNPHVIVAITSGGSVNVTPWLAKVPALVELWYPGQDGGRAFANVVLGKVDPSGRLPISWEKRLEDNPSFKNYYFNDPSKPNDIVYREGVFVGYRGYEHTGTQPLFPFGFGLSYTQFAYRKMSVSSGKNGTFIVHFFVKNTGGVKGAAVTQIYLAPPVDTLPDEPIKTLVGFTRTKLAPGEEREISVTLTPRSFTHFDVKTQQWQAASGTYTVLLGQSSEQIEGKTHVTLPVAIRIPVNAR